MLTDSQRHVASKPDGRVQRSERRKAAIVDALLELLGEGELEPTAEQVAERALRASHLGARAEGLALATRLRARSEVLQVLHVSLERAAAAMQCTVTALFRSC